MSCKTKKKLGFLADKVGEDGETRRLLAAERKNLGFIKELVQDISVFNTFLYGNDYHNLKAAIKQVYKNIELEFIFVKLYRPE